MKFSHALLGLLSTYFIGSGIAEAKRKPGRKPIPVRVVSKSRSSTRASHAMPVHDLKAQRLETASTFGHALKLYGSMNSEVVYGNSSVVPDYIAVDTGRTDGMLEVTSTGYAPAETPFIGTYRLSDLVVNYRDTSPDRPAHCLANGRLPLGNNGRVRLTDCLRRPGAVFDLALITKPDYAVGSWPPGFFPVLDVLSHSPVGGSVEFAGRVEPRRRASPPAVLPPPAIVAPPPAVLPPPAIVAPPPAVLPPPAIVAPPPAVLPPPAIVAPPPIIIRPRPEDEGPEYETLPFEDVARGRISLPTTPMDRDAEDKFRFFGALTGDFSLGRTTFSTNGAEAVYGSLGARGRVFLGAGNNKYLVGFAGGFGASALNIGSVEGLVTGFGENSNARQGDVGIAGRLVTGEGTRSEMKLLLVPAFLAQRLRVNDYAGTNFVEQGYGFRGVGELALPRLLYDGENFWWGASVSGDVEVLNVEQERLRNDESTDGITSFGDRVRAVISPRTNIGLKIGDSRIDLTAGVDAVTNYQMLLRSNLPLSEFMRLTAEQNTGRVDLSNVLGGNLWGYNGAFSFSVKSGKWRFLASASFPIYDSQLITTGGCLSLGHGLVSGGACYNNLGQNNGEGARANSHYFNAGLSVGNFDYDTPLIHRRSHADIR